ncbi:DUF2278 family protein [Gordonia sp. NPDC003424]
MSINYGVLRARPDRYTREDGQRTPHLQIRAVDDTGQPWRVAVNVQSGDGSEVVFWVVDPMVGHPILATLPTLSTGFSITDHNSAESLDYVKAPLFEFSHGRALPPSGSASADDLQDLLSLYLDQCKSAGGELYAFGAKFDSNLHMPIDQDFGNTDGLHGVHDIHMNQGNVGAHAGDNGSFHDGGLLLAFPDRIVAIALAFQTQRVPTTAAGDAAPGAQPLSAIIAATPGTTPPTTGAVYLERALINPAGDDPGHEAVVIGNLATSPTTLHGWRLVDRNGRETKLDTTLESGASTVISLDGTDVQLGNNGGNLLLLNDSGDQVDSVTYSAQEAAQVDRFVRFSR